MDHKLTEAKTSVKLLVTLFLLCMALAYLVAVVNVYDKTKFTYEGTVAHYAGNEEELAYPKEFAEMVEITHPHMLGMSMMFFLLCGIFMFSSAGEILKKIIVFASFGSIVLDLGSAWLIRYVAPPYGYLMIAAGMLMGLCFLIIFLISMKDMWLTKSKIK
jgi:hypothetical protein